MLAEKKISVIYTMEFFYPVMSWWSSWDAFNCEDKTLKVTR